MNLLLFLSKMGFWSTHSNSCSKQAMMTRNSKRGDKCACKKCFDFPFIQLVKEKVKRMEKICHIEQYLTEPTDSKTCYLEVTNFRKTTFPTLLLLQNYLENDV